MALPAKATFLAQLACDVVEECPICYEVLDKATTTTCKHTFCLECLRHWLQTANTCPCCRAKLYEERTQSTPSNENRETLAASPPPYSDSDERRWQWRNIGLLEPITRDLFMAATSQDIPATVSRIRAIQHRLGLPCRSTLPITRALQTQRAFVLVRRFALELDASAWRIVEFVVPGSNVADDRLQQFMVDYTLLLDHLFADMHQICRALELNERT